MPNQSKVGTSNAHTGVVELVLAKVSYPSKRRKARLPAIKGVNSPHHPYE